MNHIDAILNAHPNHARMDSIPGFAAAIAACLDCSIVCHSCADACVAENAIQTLQRCIRLNLDCATICGMTATMLTHAFDPDARVLHAQLRACLAACVACAEECARHAQTYEHCRICAEACHACERACQQVMERLPAMAMA
ncbi:MAG: four-helix bundle copper-binding protein [Pseudomonadota bacterium]|nr:four-helix bundle copper-binding protein [Pseudomonadota bacterium]